MKKKVLSLLLSVMLVMSTISISASAASANQFTDVKSSDWHYSAVDYAVSSGLFSGTSETTFSPNQPMTRGMFVTVLGRKSGVDAAEYPSGNFNDVAPKQYYTPYVYWAAENEIVNGTGSGKFSPDSTITREQIAKILYSYAQKTKNDTSFTTTKYFSFTDTSSVSSYAVEALQWATTHGIINGSDNKLNPKGAATRAQVAQIFMGAENILVNTEIESKPKPNPDGTYGIGDTWTVNGQWSITVTGVEETQERNPYSDKKPAAVYIVNYTYKNIGYQDDYLDGLFISLDDSIVDSAGYMGYSYPNSVTNNPQETPVGATCVAQTCIGVDHAGDFKITFSRYDGNDKKQKATFYLTV